MDPPPPVARPEVLWGVDANDVIAIEEIGGVWRVDGEEVDPIEAMAEAGAKVFWLRVFVESDGRHHTGTLDNDALALAHRAQRAGLYVVPMFLMSRGWATDANQDAPLAWQDLSIDERAVEVRAWAADAAERILDNGITTHTWGVGNETDFGFCGVYLRSDDAATLEVQVWPDAARLMQATVEGIRAGSERAGGPRDVEIIPHIATSMNPDFASAYYRAMREGGFEFTMAGLSYYPNNHGQDDHPRFYETIDRLHAELSLPVFVAEFVYVAAPCEVPEGLTIEACSLDNPERPEACPPCNPWTRVPVEGYPLTEAGQAAFVRDFKSFVHDDERVAGAIYTIPETIYSQAVSSWWGLWRSDEDRSSPGARPALQEL